MAAEVNLPPPVPQILPALPSQLPPGLTEEQYSPHLEASRVAAGVLGGNPDPKPKETTSGYWYLGPVLALIALGGTLVGLHHGIGLSADTVAAVSSVAMLTVAVSTAIFAIRNKNLCTLGKIVVCALAALALVVTGLSFGDKLASAFTASHSAVEWTVLGAGSVLALTAGGTMIYINHRRTREEV